MSKITIPPAALEAGARTLCSEQRIFWHGLTAQAQDIIRAEARVAFLAMLENWEGMTWACRGKGTPPHLLFLPLPTEASAELKGST